MAINDILFPVRNSGGGFTETIISPVAGKVLGFDTNGALILVTPAAFSGSANDIISGTLADARLSANVPLLSGGDLTLSGQLFVTGATVLDNGLSGTDDAGGFYVGTSLYLGASSGSGAGINGPSGAYFNDDGNQGWITGGNVSVGGLSIDGVSTPIIASDGALYYPVGDPLTTTDEMLHVYSAGGGGIRDESFSTVIYVDGGLNIPTASSFDGGTINTSGSGSLQLADSIYLGNNTGTGSVNGGDGGYFMADGAQGWTTGGSITAGGNLSVAYSASFGGGALTIDEFGIITAFSLGLFGATPPDTQPDTPTNFAELVTIIQQYGLCA